MGECSHRDLESAGSYGRTFWKAEPFLHPARPIDIAYNDEKCEHVARYLILTLTNQVELNTIDYPAPKPRVLPLVEGIMFQIVHSTDMSFIL
ncbi:hypothetical protein PsorP6_004731 [Peronosclerospora sorghi]|uniref:Uncharacterized protein n=1 Tax=Peronosclerospora sorghi TaxID=230839 RepID=A0ACC0VPQ2_9STRA|nr:hypothetical protein PsorP6_004731 [Peronosclerospora sorghi]